MKNNGILLLASLPACRWRTGALLQPSLDIFSRWDRKAAAGGAGDEMVRVFVDPWPAHGMPLTRSDAWQGVNQVSSAQAAP